MQVKRHRRIGGNDIIQCNQSNIIRRLCRLGRINCRPTDSKTNRNSAVKGRPDTVEIVTSSASRSLQLQYINTFKNIPRQATILHRKNRHRHSMPIQICWVCHIGETRLDTTQNIRRNLKTYRWNLCILLFINVNDIKIGSTNPVYIIRRNNLRIKDISHCNGSRSRNHRSSRTARERMFRRWDTVSSDNIGSCTGTAVQQLPQNRTFSCTHDMISPCRQCSMSRPGMRPISRSR